MDDEKVIVEALIGKSWGLQGSLKLIRSFQNNTRGSCRLKKFIVTGWTAFNDIYINVNKLDESPLPRDVKRK